MSINRSRHIGTAALSWIRQNREHFRLPADCDDGQAVTALKPLGELALTIEVVNRCGAAVCLGSNRQELQELLQWCWQQVNVDSVLLKLIAAYPDLFALCTIYPPFFRCGYRDHRFEARVRSLARITAIEAIEFPAWRALDIITSLNALGIPHN